MKTYAHSPTLRETQVSLKKINQSIDIIRAISKGVETPALTSLKDRKAKIVEWLAVRTNPEKPLLRDSRPHRIQKQLGTHTPVKS